MHIRCVHCKALGNVPQNAINRSVRCPKCGSVFTVTPELAIKGSDRRRAERMEVQGINLDFGIVAGSAQLLDLSVTGVGFEPPDAEVDFNKGDVACFTLMDKQRVVLEEVHVRITRKASGSLGGEFENLSDLQLNEIKQLLAQQRFRKTSETQQQNDLELGEGLVNISSKDIL